MKHSSKKALSGFIAMSMALPIAASPELLSVNDILTVKAADQQKTGKTSDGYDYELWNQNGTGNVTMDLGSNGGFSCSWSGIENCLFRTGKKLGSTKGYKDYGNITIDYDVDYQPNGNSYMCVYGWTEDPTVEYYIVEAWGDWRPPGSNASKGTVSSDGKSYDIYTSTRVNQPSIHGTETFEQYWSVNKTNPAKVYAETNLKGTITVSDHFAAWEKSGMKMGKMYEVALNIEGYRSEGKANVKKNVLTIGGSGSTTPSQTTTDPGTTTQNPAQGQSQDNPWGQMPWGQNDPAQGQSQDNPWGQMPWGQTDPAQGQSQDNPWGQMPWGQTDPTQGQNQDPGQSQTPTTGSSSFTASSSLSDIQKTAKAEFTATVPGDATKTDSGKMSKIQYQSKKAGRTKPANVWLPEGYTEGKKYPVLYVNHGVMGGEDDMTKGWGICEMASYFIKKGTVQPFIIVFTQMYTGPNERPGGITQQDMDYYDDFLYDLTESLMPYMAEHYSVAEGRENTAICGFSMGGRESLYIGMKACDKIGYVAASSPAPGIVPAQDMFLNHRGSMTESEFKFATTPYLLMIGGGTNDSVVGTFPKQYHELYDKNGVDNIWFEKAGAGHDASVGTPLFYNFIGHIFPVASAGSSQPQPTAQTQPTTQSQPTQQSQAPASQQPQTQPSQQSGGTNGSAADFKFGDINDDTKIDITDLSLLAVHLIDKTKFTDKQTLAADVAYNGKLELADLATLRQFISKVIDKLGDGYVAPVNQPVASPSPSKQASPSPSPSKQASPSPSPSKQASPSPSPSQSTFTASGKTYSVGNGQNQHKGDNVDGYSYEIWLDQTGGSGSMTLGSGGTFSTEWSAECSRGNFLARRGRNYDATKKATDYGTIVMDYAADYSASAAGNSRLCVYGWMKNPLVEYYIIEDWVNWCPSPNGQSKTVTIDGSEYEIFQLDHTGPTILGTTETFKQYFSVRKSKRTSGTITVSDHFKAWANAGWNIGNLTEVALNVEGWESSGKANVTKLTIGTGSGESSNTQQAPQQNPGQNPGQNPWGGQMPWGGDQNPNGGQNPGEQQVPQQTAKSTGSKGKVQNGVWTSDADVSWIDASKPMVAISFDDGPIGGSQNPSRIHNALTKNGFHATFFYWGERIAGNEQEIKNAFNAGFEVANHTWTHPYLTQQGDKGKSEVQKTKNALDAIIGGDNDYLLRPPYLSFDASVGQAVGVPCPNCGLDTQDWNGASKDQIVNTLKSALANGSLRNKVVLCHENYDSTAGAMEEFLPYLKSQGWQCVTVSEMFKAQGKTMQAGQLYNECK